MELKESDKLSPNEGLESIKDDCRSQAKLRLCYGAVFLLLILALLVYTFYTDRWKDQVFLLYICQSIVYCLAIGWFVVNNLRFLKRANSAVAPEELLHGFEKTMKNNRNAYYLFFLALIGIVIDPHAFVRHEWNWVWVDLAIVIAMLALLIYSYFKGDFLKYKTRRDENIIQRLQELVEKE